MLIIRHFLVFQILFTGLFTSWAHVIVVQPEDDVSTIINSAQPGDTVLFSHGIYQGPLVLTVSGVPDLPVVLMSERPIFKEYAVVDGGAEAPALEANHNWLVLNNSSWVEFINFQFQNGWTDPVRVNNSNYISFKNCFFSGGRKVILASGSNTHHVLVENCYWDQAGRYSWNVIKWKGEDSWDAMHHGGLSFFNGSLFACEGTSGSHVIRGNTIRHAFNGLRWKAQQNKDANIDIYENDISYLRDNDFEPERFAYNLFIYNNSSHNVHKTLSVDNVNGGNIYYFGNTITTDNDTRTKNLATGFYKVYGEDRNITEPLYIFNNSYYGTGKVHGSINGRKIQHVVHYNNAFELTRRDWELNQWNETLNYDYDCSNKPFSEILTDNGQENNGIVASPDYLDPEGRDLKLKPNSPCLDAGTPLSIPALNWTQGFEGPAPDIGAFDDGSRIKGPFFRVVADKEVAAAEELPRISQFYHTDEYIDISFTFPLDLATIAENIVLVYENGERELLVDFELHNANHTVRVLRSSEAEVPASIEVLDKLKGTNELQATNWASASKFKFQPKDEIVGILTMPLSGGSIVIDQNEHFVAKGDKVTFIAVPDEGYHFVSWEGDLSGTAAETTTTVNHGFWVIAYFKKDEITGLDDLQERSFPYPNPTGGRLTLPAITGNPRVEFIQVHDIAGHELKFFREMNSKELDLGDLASGTYFLTVQYNDRILSYRIIINR